MTISRNHKNQNYTIIDNRILYDKNLSWKAKSILIYALAQSENWNFYRKEIASHSKGGLDSFDSGVKELKKFGYLKVVQSRSNDGTFGEYIWNWYETPQVEEDSKNTEMGFSQLGKSETNNTKDNNTKPMLKRTKKKKKPKQNTHCSSFQEIKKLIPEADDGAIIFWLKTWGYDVVIAAVKLTLSRKNVGNKAGYTRKLLNEGITDLSESDLKNKALAEEYAEVNKAIKVNKAYAVLNNNKEVYYKMSNQEFENILKNEFRGDEEIISIEDMLGEAYVDYLINQNTAND